MNADVKKIVKTAKKIYAKIVELIKSALIPGQKRL